MLDKTALQVLLTNFAKHTQGREHGLRYLVVNVPGTQVAVSQKSKGRVEQRSKSTDEVKRSGVA